MEWISDPTIWVGLATLVALEIVLGIDNIIFIAILSDKLPPERRDRARQIGLTLACAMRLALLASISWVMSLTAPVVEAWALALSWRDLILIGGGGFLLVKATIEMHDRLEARPLLHTRSAAPSGFWPIVAQIVVLDAVFSLDSVITAIGMVDELPVMMAAVVIAVAVMIVASKPLTRFINAHPALIILCLGFLLMVGLVLIADGLGYHIPKGYLYAAIGFSVLIEIFNQVALRNRRKWAATMPLRQRTADAVLRLLGGVPLTAPSPDVEPALAAGGIGEDAFTLAEKQMVREVLLLAEQPVQVIMTPRLELVWIDADASKEAILDAVRGCPHRHFLVSRGTVDDVLGIARRADLFELCLADRPCRLADIVHEPLTLHEGASILDTLRAFKRAPLEIALVVDEYGTLQGIVTQTDLLEAIAGNLPQSPGEAPEIEELKDGSLRIDAGVSMHDVQMRLSLGALPPGGFNTLAGFILWLFDRVPAVGERVEWAGWRFEVTEINGMRVSRVHAQRRAPGDDHSPMRRY